MTRIRFDVYGRRVAVDQARDGWSVFYLGDEGKSRPADDLLIPSSIGEDELQGYLADLCHEWASAEHPTVRRLD